MSATSWRRATADDAEELRDLERDANLVGLAHVFGDLAFPDDAVLARWRTTLDEPGVTVMLRAEAFTAWDDVGRLRHLAVRPDAWGRGLGQEGVELAAAAIRAAGQLPVLWVLELNHRARALYERLGWAPTGHRRRAEWPPHPVELELGLRH